MSLIQGNTKVSAGGYEIDQSIRFNDDDTAYLTRTPSSNGDRRTFTWSGWVKIGAGAIASNSYLLATTGGSSDSGYFTFYINQTYNSLSLTGYNTVWRRTSQVFRDPSAWYHIVIRVDSTNATADDRIRIYVNGEQVTSFQTSSNPSLNHDFGINTTSNTTYLFSESPTGGGPTSDKCWDGYGAEINFIDGQSLAPTDFGETNDDGVWIPKKYAGTYGTNGFYLKGQDSSNLGDDSSGNNNDFTSSGLTSADQRADTPTNNLMTFNPLNNMRDDGDPTDGNRVFYNTGGTRNLCGTTFHFNTGKYVQAFSIDSAGTQNWTVGLMPSDEADVNDAPGSNEDLNAAAALLDFGTYYVGTAGSSANTGVTVSTADTMWVAYDADSGKQWVGIYDDSAASMVWFNSSGGSTGDPATGANPVVTGTANASLQFAVGGRNSRKITLLEESEATGTVPSGFTYVGAVQDAYAAPAITDGSAYFQTTLYSGNGSTQEINQSENSTFQPDCVWIKERNTTRSHVLYDAVRGTTKYLQTNETDAEGTLSGVTSFDADGFTVGSHASSNNSGSTYAAWQWLAANGTASNTDGSITSTVSANTTAGFSIVSYTGNGSASQTVGHGLGVTPTTVIIKPRSRADHWLVSNWENGVTAFTEKLKFNDTEAASGSSNQITAGSSTTFTIGSDPNINASGSTYIAYVWSEVEGFSKFGTYTGNGSTDGPFNWCGFRPAWVMLKRTDSADNWVLIDAGRNPYNVANLRLYPDTTNADITSTTHDLLSNGFKLRASDGGVNGSGGTYIFMAFAENPFGGDGVAPVPAR